MISQTTKIPESITTLLILSKSYIDEKQNISVMTGADPSDLPLNNQLMNDEFLGIMAYQCLDSILRQCDKGSVAVTPEYSVIL